MANKHSATTRPVLRLVTSPTAPDPEEEEQLREAKRYAAFAPRLSPGYTEGALLAIEMLDDFQESTSVVDACAIEPQWHPGKPQRDIVAEYLPRLGDDSEVARGFTSMLSCALSRALDDVCPRSEWLELLARMSPVDATAEWDRLRQEGAV